VLEHVARPAEYVAEVRRVLRKQGVFVALTPNRYHYVSLVATVTPNCFHKWLNRRRGRSAEDTFPTFYRMNSPRALRGIFEGAGFKTLVLRMVEVQPNYLTFCTPAFLCGAVYERVVNACEMFAALRVNIVCVFRKE